MCSADLWNSKKYVDMTAITFVRVDLMRRSLFSSETVAIVFVLLLFVCLFVCLFSKTADIVVTLQDKKLTENKRYREMQSQTEKI